MHGGIPVDICNHFMCLKQGIVERKKKLTVRPVRQRLVCHAIQNDSESGDALDFSVLLGLRRHIKVDEVNCFVQVFQPINIVLAQYALALLMLANL